MYFLFRRDSGHLSGKVTVVSYVTEAGLQEAKQKIGTPLYECSSVKEFNWRYSIDVVPVLVVKGHICTGETEGAPLSEVTERIDALKAASIAFRDATREMLRASAGVAEVGAEVVESVREYHGTKAQELKALHDAISAVAQIESKQEEGEPE